MHRRFHPFYGVTDWSCMLAWESDSETTWSWKIAGYVSNPMKTHIQWFLHYKNLLLARHSLTAMKLRGFDIYVFFVLSRTIFSLYIIDLVFKMQIWAGGNLDSILDSSRRHLGQVSYHLLTSMCVSTVVFTETATYADIAELDLNYKSSAVLGSHCELHCLQITTQQLAGILEFLPWSVLQHHCTTYLCWQ